MNKQLDTPHINTDDQKDPNQALKDAAALLSKYGVPAYMAVISDKEVLCSGSAYFTREAAKMTIAILMKTYGIKKSEIPLGCAEVIQMFTPFRIGAPK